MRQLKGSASTTVYSGTTAIHATPPLALSTQERMFCIVITLTAELTAHQKSNARRPSLKAIVANERAGVDVLRWQRWYSGPETDSPNAAAVTPTGALLRAYNDAGTLKTSRVAAPDAFASFSAWTTTAAATAATGIALAARTGEALLAYVDSAGLKLQLRTSTDDGATWSAPALIVTEASAIGAVALAFTPSGDACLFYTLGTSSTLKRLRRTAGVWAASGTNWSKSASVATLTGIAVCHDSADFQLVITGTEVTTNNPRVWGASMGDTFLPPNFWTGPSPIAEADALSTVSFKSPTLAVLGTQATGRDLHALFTHRESGNVAEDRVYYTHAAALTDAPSGTWIEPFPHEATGQHGPSLAAAAGSADVFLTSPSGVWHASRGQVSDVSSRVLSCDYEITPTSSRCRLELDNHDGSLSQLPTTDFPAVMLGATLTLTPGYNVDGAVEAGVAEPFEIVRIAYSLSRGRRSVTLECSGAWERLARWRAPQAIQFAPAATARDAIFIKIAGRAGVRAANGSSPHAPSSDWSASQPAFAIAAGERGDSVLSRLLEPVSDFMRPSADQLEAIGPTTADPPAYALGVELSAAILFDAPQPANWVRLQGPGRYADAVAYNDAYGSGPILRTVRNLGATDNTKAAAWAANAAPARRDVVMTEHGQLTLPFHAGLQLLDVVSVADIALELPTTSYRIIGIRFTFSRKDPNPRYDTTLTLGGL